MFSATPYTDECNLLIQESILCNSILNLGTSVLLNSKPHSYEEGLMYSSFFNISIGIERFFKICLIIEYYSNYKEYPKGMYLKDHGHAILELYNTLIKKFNSNETYYLKKYRKQLIQIRKNHEDYDLFFFLTAFSESTRYHNFNQITQNFSKNDIKYSCEHPINSWIQICSEYMRIKLGGDTLERLLENLIFNSDLGYSHFCDHKGNKILNSQVAIDQYLVSNGNKIILEKMLKLTQPFYLIMCDITNHDIKKIDAKNKTAPHNEKYNLPEIEFLMPFFK